MEHKIAFERAFKMCCAAKTIAIVGHVRPDGDCVGSALALRSHLVELGHETTVFIEGPMPKRLSFLGDIDKVCEDLPDTKELDLLVILDMSSDDRMGKFAALRERAQKVICFDHHIGNQIKADLLIADPAASSCGEILYQFFAMNGVTITRVIAEALYTAISTDTGCFLYPSTTAATHRAAAALMDTGIDIETINYSCFRAHDQKFITDIQKVLGKLKYRRGGEIVFVSLVMKRFAESDRDKIKQIVADIRGVRVSIIMARTEKKMFYISLRSHGNVHVEKVARYFGGGGHKNAAGFNVEGRYKSVRKRVLRVVENLLDGRDF